MKHVYWLIILEGEREGAGGGSGKVIFEKSDKWTR